MSMRGGQSRSREHRRRLRQDRSVVYAALLLERKGALIAPCAAALWFRGVEERAPGGATPAFTRQVPRAPSCAPNWIGNVCGRMLGGRVRAAPCACESKITQLPRAWVPLSTAVSNKSSGLPPLFMNGDTLGLPKCSARAIYTRAQMVYSQKVNGASYRLRREKRTFPPRCTLVSFSQLALSAAKGANEWGDWAYRRVPHLQAPRGGLRIARAVIDCQHMACILLSPLPFCSAPMRALATWLTAVKWDDVEVSEKGRAVHELSRHCS